MPEHPFAIGLQVYERARVTTGLCVIVHHCLRVDIAKARALFRTLAPWCSPQIDFGALFRGGR
jgi:hypothetical protein